MTYVWIKESAGSMRYVDDIYLSPCQKCGKRISQCTCLADAEYDRLREKENEGD
jgi:hypothetical protein